MRHAMPDRAARGGRYHAGSDAAWAGVDPGRRGVRPFALNLLSSASPRRGSAGVRRGRDRRRAPVVPAALAGHGLSLSRRSAARRSRAAGAGRAREPGVRFPPGTLLGRSAAEGAQRRAERTGGGTRTSARGVRPRERRLLRHCSEGASRPRRRRCRSASPRWCRTPPSMLVRRAGSGVGQLRPRSRRPYRRSPPSSTPPRRRRRAPTAPTSRDRVVLRRPWNAAVAPSAPSPPIARRRGSRGASTSRPRVLRKGTIGGAGGALDQAALADAAAASRRSLRFRRRRCGLGGRSRAVHRFAAASRRAAPRSGREAARPDAGASFSDDLDESAICSCAASRPRTRRSPGTRRRGSADPLDRHAALESPDALGHAIARWRRRRPHHGGRRGCRRLLRLTPGHADEAALVAAARAVPSSPAYPSLAFDRARLLIREEADEARALAAEMAKASPRGRRAP